MASAAPVSPAVAYSLSELKVIRAILSLDFSWYTSRVKTGVFSSTQSIQGKSERLKALLGRVEEEIKRLTPPLEGANVAGMHRDASAEAAGGAGRVVDQVQEDGSEKDEIPRKGERRPDGGGGASSVTAIVESPGKSASSTRVGSIFPAELQAVISEAPLLPKNHTFESYDRTYDLIRILFSNSKHPFLLNFGIFALFAWMKDSDYHDLSRLLKADPTYYNLTSTVLVYGRSEFLKVYLLRGLKVFDLNLLNAEVKKVFSDNRCLLGFALHWFFLNDSDQLGWARKFSILVDAGADVRSVMRKQSSHFIGLWQIDQYARFYREAHITILTACLRGLGVQYSLTEEGFYGQRVDSSNSLCINFLTWAVKYYEVALFQELWRLFNFLWERKYDTDRERVFIFKTDIEFDSLAALVVYHYTAAQPEILNYLLEQAFKKVDPKSDKNSGFLRKCMAQVLLAAVRYNKQEIFSLIFKYDAAFPLGKVAYVDDYERRQNRRCSAPVLLERAPVHEAIAFLSGKTLVDMLVFLKGVGAAFLEKEAIYQCDGPAYAILKKNRLALAWMLVNIPLTSEGRQALEVQARRRNDEESVGVLSQTETELRNFIERECGVVMPSAPPQEQISMLGGDTGEVEVQEEEVQNPNPEVSGAAGQALEIATTPEVGRAVLAVEATRASEEGLTQIAVSFAPIHVDVSQSEETSSSASASERRTSESEIVEDVASHISALMQCIDSLKTRLDGAAEGIRDRERIARRFEGIVSAGELESGSLGAAGGARSIPPSVPVDVWRMRDRIAAAGVTVEVLSHLMEDLGRDVEAVERLTENERNATAHQRQFLQNVGTLYETYRQQQGSEEMAPSRAVP